MGKSYRKKTERGNKNLSSTLWFYVREKYNRCTVSSRILMEKYREEQKELHCVFMGMEKAYNTVPNDELWYCLRKAGLTASYGNVQDMYKGSKITVNCTIWSTNWSNVKIGLRRGSNLSPLLFAIITPVDI